MIGSEAQYGPSCKEEGARCFYIPDKTYWFIYKLYFYELCAKPYKYNCGKYVFQPISAYNDWAAGDKAFKDAQRVYANFMDKAQYEEAHGIRNGYQQAIDEYNSKRGVYGVYRKETDELVYIGSTYTDYAERWQQHLDIGKFDDEYYEMRPLYTIKEMEDEIDTPIILQRDLRLIEFMLIKKYNPSMNREGRNKKFKIQEHNQIFYQIMNINRM